MLIPGFVVTELPVQLPSLNNIEYSQDGRLFAAGYDGRFHVLRDSDDDGLEDRVDTFWQKTAPNYPVGMIVKQGEVFANMGSEIVRFRDVDGDGIPETRETAAVIADDPELAQASFLIHRRVDIGMALAIGPDGAFYVAMGNAGYNNPYWKDHKGDKGYHYAPEKRRGCLLKIAPGGQIEQLNSGLRYIMSLQWNAQGDLFGTDQEGATWCPNGNPFDELLHLEPRRHYGFPPRHPQHLPDVVDEPSVWDYGPQHQSTCGFRFNSVQSGRASFGPKSWQDNAIVTGASRGNVWRTSLAKTSTGYVARTDLIARSNLLVVDCAISPRGELVLCCQTGRPDWGNGPSGEGRLFKIRYVDQHMPQPLYVWAKSPTETEIVFDRTIDESLVSRLAAGAKITGGRYVTAADEFEKMRPGYAIVQMQQRQPRLPVTIRSVRAGARKTTVIIETEPRDKAYTYALTLNGRSSDAIYLDHGLFGLASQWSGEGDSWQGWLPHVDLAASRTLLAGGQDQELLAEKLNSSGKFVLQGQLDLNHMLQPVTQPGSQLDYVPSAERVTVVFKADSRLDLETAHAKVEKISEQESHLTFTNQEPFTNQAPRQWPAIQLRVDTPVKDVQAFFFTDRDARPRALSTTRFLVPFAKPGNEDLVSRAIPELAGGNWEAGEKLYHGKAACATCHVFRGQGSVVGADLNNLVHRDYASVLRDLVDPNATINPDAIAYAAVLLDGSVVSGTRFRENKEFLELAQPGGKVVKLDKQDIEAVKPMSISLMPSDLSKVLTPVELRDLLTYLMIDR